MKKLCFLFGLIAVCASVYAGSPSYSAYSASGSGTLTNSAIIGANALLGNSIPIVTTLDASGAVGGWSAQLYKCTNLTVFLNTNVSANTYPVSNTNGLAGSVIVVRHVSNDTYERALVSSIGDSTNVVLTAAVSQAIMPNDILYQMTPAGSIASVTNSGAGTFGVRLIGDAIVAGQPGKPLLVDVISGAGTNAVVNLLTAKLSP